MAFIKCPRCELNYINESEKFCKVCLREMQGETPKEEVEMCTICNDAPAMPGKDICLFCYKEMNGDSAADEEEAAANGEVQLDPVSTMDEIIPEIEEDIPEDAYDDMRTDLSLEEMEEDEDNDDEEDDD